MRTRVLGLAMGLLLMGAGNGWAQVVWDSPFMVPPQAGRGLGVFLVDVAAGGTGVLGTWRSGRGPQALGFRLGVAEDNLDDLAVFGGVDVSGAVMRATTDFPLDISWVTGAGAGVSENVRLSVPLGLAVGRTFEADEARFTPYLTPRVVLDALFGNGSDLGLDLAVDLGIDFAFQPGWLVRFGGTLGDREAVAIGVVF